MHAESFHGKQSRDPSRGSMVKMEVVNRDCTNLTLEGNLVPIGRHTITVYKDDVPNVMAQVESSQDKIARAYDHYMLKVAESVKGRIGFSGDLEALSAMLQDKARTLPDDMAAAYKSVLQSTPRSVCASFNELTGRGIRPLESARVIEGSEHPDHHMVAKQEEAKLLHSVLHGAATAQAAVGLTAEQVAAMIEAGIEKGVRAELARMKAQGKAKAGDEG